MSAIPDKPYEVREPSVGAIPVLVSIPHPGIYVPETISRDFASDYIRSLPMTDWHLHHLYDFLPALGITMLFATYSRFVADLNRPPDDRPLYPGRFETGCVAFQTFWGESIYRVPPPQPDVDRRRDQVHAPYHAKLLELIDARIRRFGKVVLLDVHSVPSRANLLHGALTGQVYLGDRDGHSCAPWLTDTIEQAFRGAGLMVTRNDPYKGGYITDHYGAMDHVEAVQIEMCQRVYMDEARPGEALEHPAFSEAKTRIHNVFNALCTRTVGRWLEPG